MNNLRPKASRPSHIASAFTLIELLVVIAIIAILAAILFPVFAQAKEAAKKAACLSNMKQVATGTIMYMADYDDRLYGSSYNVYYTPPTVANQYWWGYETSTDSGSTWTVDAKGALLYPYTKNNDIFDCPTAVDLITDVPNERYPAYAVNGDVFQAKPTGSQFDLPAETIVMADAANYLQGRLHKVFQSFSPSNFFVSPPTTLFPEATINGRHNGKANVAWFDGHAKANNVEVPSIDLINNSRWDYYAIGGNHASLQKALTNYHLGWLIRSGCSLGSSCQNFYYALTKPAVP